MIDLESFKLKMDLLWHLIEAKKVVAAAVAGKKGEKAAKKPAGMNKWIVFCYNPARALQSQDFVHIFHKIK